MKKLKGIKSCCLILCAIMVAAGMTACADSATGTPSSGGSATDATGSKDPYGAYAEPISYSVARYVQTNTKLPNGDTYEDNAYTRYVEKKLNAKLVTAFEATGEEYDRQISLAIVSGDLPDIMPVQSEEILKELVENDLIADLTQVYADYATDVIKEKYDSYNGRCLDGATFDNKLMALPGAQGDGGPHIVWVREDWLKTVGLSEIGDENGVLTVAELEEIAKTFVAKDPGNSKNPVGIALTDGLAEASYGGSHNIMALSAAYGAYPKVFIPDAEGKTTYGSIQPEMKETLTTLARWYKEGIIDPQAGVRTWDDINALMINNQMGITMGAWHVTDWMLPSVKEMNPEATFKAFTLADANGKINTFHTNAVSRYIVVRKDFEYPELAVKLANIQYDDLDSEITDEGIMEYQSIGVDGSTKPLWIELAAADDLVSGYLPVREVALGKATEDTLKTTAQKTLAKNIMEYITDPATASTSAWSQYHSRMRGIEQISQMYDKGLINWISPTFFGTTKTMESNWANLDTMEKEVFFKIITGEEKIDGFDTFVTNWKAQGGDTILSEIDTELSE